LPSGSNEQRIREEALARRISLYTLGEHCVRPRPEAALLLGYAVSPEPAIRAAVAKLAEAVEAASA
jgi:DNA-binding transcriptional MocR family regulator